MKGHAVVTFRLDTHCMMVTRTQYVSHFGHADAIRIAFWSCGRNTYFMLSIVTASNKSTICLHRRRRTGVTESGRRNPLGCTASSHATALRCSPPSTLSTQPSNHSTLSTQHSTLNTQYSTLNTHSTLNAAPSYLNSQTSTLNTQHSNNTRPSTLNSQPSALNPQPSTIKLHIWLRMC